MTHNDTTSHTRSVRQTLPNAQSHTISSRLPALWQTFCANIYTTRRRRNHPYGRIYDSLEPQYKPDLIVFV